ncbi:L-dopachrome tautomerase-related protein [Lentisphaerota bacterium WC36G]|nr:major royal jelly family protein [Lentisphaerae bacterium WC36]
MLKFKAIKLFLSISFFSFLFITLSLAHEISIVSSSKQQWTGIAINKENRIFVNFPTWSDNVPIKVAEIIKGKAVSFPNEKTNLNLFKAVQSVIVDKKNRLWVLDTCNPNFKGVLAEGPKLYQYNLATNTLNATYHFSEKNYHKDSYFNDIRIDETKNYAYITDSGNGAIIVLNLTDGKSRRLLQGAKAVQSEKNYLICDGIKWENSVDSDGIGLTNDKKYLYFIALTSHSLYRIKTQFLRDEKISNQTLEKKVEFVAKVPATDGIIFDKNDNLYLGGLEDNSINILSKKNKISKFVKPNKLIRWADSFAFDNEGNLYFTTSQIHLPKNQRLYYDIIKVKLSK